MPATVIETYEKDASMNLNAIRALMKNHEFEKAFQELDEALLLHPENTLFWILRGHVIQLFDSIEGPSLLDAEKSYLKALEIEPSNLDAIESLAHFYDAVAKNPDKAKEYADSYLSITQKVSEEMRSISRGE